MYSTKGAQNMVLLLKMNIHLLNNIIACLACLFWALTGSAQSYAKSKCAGSAAGAISRPVVLSGLKEIRGVSLHSLSVWRLEGERIEPALFQVDEKNDRDEFVLPHGKPFTRHDGNGRVDIQDELVIASSDLLLPTEEKQFLNAWKKKNLAGKLWQIGVCVPGQGVDGLLFLSTGVKQASLPKKPTKAVQFDAKSAVVKTKTYKYEFQKEHPLLLGKVSMRTKNSYKPIIESSQMRIPIKSAWYLPNTTLSAKSFRSEIESWKQGPLRSIVAVGVKYEKLFSLVKLHMFSEWIFYESHFQIPQTVIFPLNFKKYLRPGSGIAYSIRLVEPKSWKWSANIPRVRALSAKQIVKEGRSTTLPASYSARAVNLKNGWTIQAGLRIDPDRLTGNPSPFLLVGEDFGSRRYIKNWPWIEKIPGDFGVFQDFSQIQSGSYDFGLDLSLGNDAKQVIPDLRTAQTSWKALF